MPQIPPHNTPQGTSCRSGGRDSRTGVCAVCAPQPALSGRATAALAALAALATPVTGPDLAARMRRPGRVTSPAAAHQAGAGLARGGLAIKATPDGEQHIRYQITITGRDWIARYQIAGGRVPTAIQEH